METLLQRVMKNASPELMKIMITEYGICFRQYAGKDFREISRMNHPFMLGEDLFFAKYGFALKFYLQQHSEAKEAVIQEMRSDLRLYIIPFTSQIILFNVIAHIAKHNHCTCDDCNKHTQHTHECKCNNCDDCTYRRETCNCDDCEEERRESAYWDAVDNAVDAKRGN